MAQELLDPISFYPSIGSELRLLMAICGLFLLPGLALLVSSRSFAHWRPLERLLLALGLSISIYPILFYAARLLSPTITLGPLSIGSILLVSGLLILIKSRQRGPFKSQFGWIGRMTRAEWAAVGILLLTAISRLWVAHTHPYPAWTDSLHHAIIVDITIGQGFLPRDLNPLFDIPLNVYHLGLYAIATSAAWLAQVPAHLALQWTAQSLNTLAGIGIYLALSRMAGPVGAVAGLFYVSLISHQPAYYVNWGRYTQLASQVIIPIAWITTIEAIQCWGSMAASAQSQNPGGSPESEQPGPKSRPSSIQYALVAGLLTGAVFLFHFRVAVFYILLLFISVLWLGWRSAVEQRFRAMLQSTVAIGLFSAFFIFPSLWEILYNYYTTYVRANQFDFPELLDPELIEQFVNNYYNFSLDTVPLLAAREPWLILTGLLALCGLLFRNRITMLTLCWIGLLYGIGSAYRLGIQGLSVTNMGAVLIMLYIPFGVLIGCGMQELFNRVPWSLLNLSLARQGWLQRIAVALLLLCAIPFAQERAQALEPSRYFVTENDLEAMGWIAANTEPTARFAVRTTFWLPLGPHGVDAGYWIPYFTDRTTTAGTMLTAVSLNEHHKEILVLSRAATELESDPATALLKLLDQGVSHIYLGSSGFQHLSSLTAEALLATNQVELVFQNKGVSILAILPQTLVNDSAAWTTKG